MNRPPGWCFLLASLATVPAPARAGEDLVEITTLEPSIRLDVRYATARNFLARPVYPEGRALLLRDTAEALARVHRSLRPHGYGLLVFDGYRPWSVTKLFWDEAPPGKRAFVADPARGSNHNRGCAVDLSLYDLASGRETEMPSAYDEFSARASPRYGGGTAEQRARRDLLRRAMEAEGFTVGPNEWWHFSHRGCRSHPVLDVPFGALAPAKEPGFRPRPDRP